LTANFDALRSGGHVVVIGGGPGGTACALALKRIADEISSPIKITILESKQFLYERHYNQCVGVLSPPLPELLEERLYIPFPRELCLVDIDGARAPGRSVISSPTRPTDGTGTFSSET